MRQNGCSARIESADTAVKTLLDRGLGMPSFHSKQHILILQSNKRALGQEVAPNIDAGMLVFWCNCRQAS